MLKLYTEANSSIKDFAVKTFSFKSINTAVYPYGLGLLQATSRTPKPALAALSQIQSWLGEREVSNCRTVASGVWSCELLDAGRRAVADLLWAESATASMTAVPADLRTRWAGCQPPGESLVPAGRLSSLTLKPAPLLCPRATR